MHVNNLSDYANCKETIAHAVTLHLDTTNTKRTVTVP